MNNFAKVNAAVDAIARKEGAIGKGFQTAFDTLDVLNSM